MRSVRWLHISDIHLDGNENWSQDVVFTAMFKQIKSQCSSKTVMDFILLTGDLAYSGKPKEYKMVAEFLDNLSVVSSVPKERIFCIPGNHDIDRSRQSFCFNGARENLQDQSRVDNFLAGGEELETLLKRQENYRNFLKTYFSTQERKPTIDGLGYVSWLKIDNVRFAIIGLDSAWLSQGGTDDHGKLLVGERQIISAIKHVKQYKNPVHIVVAMTHHPLHILHEFDRRAAMNIVETECHFLHFGHMHVPEARPVGIGTSGCLTLGAGASFETRQSHNSFSVVTLDLLYGKRKVKTFQYIPSDGLFSNESKKEYPIEINPTKKCEVRELAQALRTYDTRIAKHSYYLSSLILERKAEYVIPIDSGHSFASFSVLQELPSSELKTRTESFQLFRNILRVLYESVPLQDILINHGESILKYDEVLQNLCKDDPILNDQIDEKEQESRTIAASSLVSDSYTSILLNDLAEEKDWLQLKENAILHSKSPDPNIRLLAKKMLALSLANFEDIADKKESIKLYQSLLKSESADFLDMKNLSILLFNLSKYEEARNVILDGMEKFPKKYMHFREIGHRLVEATGDRDLWEKLRNN